MNSTENWDAKYRSDPRTTEELLELARTKDMETDDEAYWHPIRCLQHRLPTIAERIEPLLQSANPKLREAAATVLGQNSVEEKWDVPRCADQLHGALKQESSAEVLSSMVHALGHLHDPRSIEAILPLATHAAADVRYAVVHCLSNREDPRAVQALLQLSADADGEVRNWATFGIGSMVETDTPEIRAALRARLREPDEEIRGEALVGLARRRDAAMIPALLRELDSRQPEALQEWPLLKETANILIENAVVNFDPPWLPVLQRLRTLRLGDAARLELALKAG